MIKIIGLLLFALLGMFLSGVCGFGFTDVRAWLIFLITLAIYIVGLIEGFEDCKEEKEEV